MLPAQARQLQNARAVFWVGPELEVFLDKAISTIANRSESVPLLHKSGIQLLSFRGSGIAEHKEEIHGKEKYQSSGGEAAHATETHGHVGLDPHIWLDPHNASEIVKTIALTLSNLDPDNAEKYQSNAIQVMKRIDLLDRETQALLAPIRDREFVTFHDAFQYFEKRYRLNSKGTIAVNPESAPGAARIAQVKTSIVGHGIRCIFAEPQFPSALLEVIARDTAARIAVLDPLGAELLPGPDAYFQLIKNMASSIRECLS
jgi:zinc transport system substrate-binding protein